MPGRSRRTEGCCNVRSDHYNSNGGRLVLHRRLLGPSERAVLWNRTKVDLRKFSDRYGRTLILAITVFGVLLTCVRTLLAYLCVNFILQGSNPHISSPFRPKYYIRLSIYTHCANRRRPSRRYVSRIASNWVYHNRVFQESHLDRLLDMLI